MIVSDLDGRHIMIILETEKDVISALTQAPRRVGTSLFRLFKWTPEFHLRKESTIITVWIRFPSLRPDLFNDGILKCLCQPIGKFLDSDGHTKNRTRCAFARCCVEINIAKALPSEIWIDTGDGAGWWQEIIYESNLKYCSKCRLHGHNLSECRKARGKPQDRNGDIREQGVTGQGITQAKGKEKEQSKQGQPQDWIPVKNKNPRTNTGGKSSHRESDLQRKASQRDENPFNPIVIEEEEMIKGQEPQGETTEIARIDEADQPRFGNKVLAKSSSEGNLTELKGLDYMDKEPLIRSNSMSDFPVECSERRLDYLKEEFHHYHLIAKHLQRTKEETLKRLHLMEVRKDQERASQEVSLQSMDEDNQLGIISQVPDCQLDNSQGRQVGEISQKKKKGVQAIKKPVTRASKKASTPKK